MISQRITSMVLATLFAVALARPGAPNYPSEEENTIPDYAYDNNEETKLDPAYVGGWKSIPVASPDKFYDDEAPATNPVPDESSTTASPETKVSEVVEVVRAAEAAGSVGAVAAVQAVEVVKAALETTDIPETTTAYPTTYSAPSGRALGDDDERPQGDSPTATSDQTFYGFSKFLHDLLQVPVQVMRSVSSYLTGAFNSRHEPPGPVSPAVTPQEQSALTSAMLSQSF